MSRQVIGPLGRHRVVCSDGTVWWLKKLEGADIRPDGLQLEWVLQARPIPQVEILPAKRRGKK